MITGARAQSTTRPIAIQSGEEGQAIFEFLFFLPMLLTIVFLVIKVNTAIQISIVNQQYARSQALFLSYNSPHFPELRLKQSQAELMILGVAEEVTPQDDDEGQFVPSASTIRIIRQGSTILGNNEPKELPDERGDIRIRSTVAMCGESVIPIAPSTEESNFDYCRSPI